MYVIVWVIIPINQRVFDHIFSGCSRVRLTSPVLELDPIMDTELVKAEPKWCGADVEKQFVLRAKVCIVISHSFSTNNHIVFTDALSS